MSLQRFVEQQEYIHRYRDPERSTIPEDFEEIDENTFAEPKRHQVSGEFPRPRSTGWNAFQSNSSRVVDLPPPSYESLYQSSGPKRCAVSKNSHRSYLSRLSKDISVPETYLREIISRKNILWQIHHLSGAYLSARTLLWRHPQTVPGIQWSRIHILCQAIRNSNYSNPLPNLSIRSGDSHTIYPSLAERIA